MSITIFSSQSKYSTITSQVIMNELGALWDTTRWKNSQNQSVVLADGSTDVEKLYISDSVYITQGGTNNAQLTITNSSGATNSVYTNINTSAFVIVKTDACLLFFSLYQSQAFYFVVAKTIDSASAESWGCIWKYTAGSGSYSLYTFTDKIVAPTATANTLNGAAKTDSIYYTQITPIYTAGSDERFDETVFMVRQRTSESGGRYELGGQKYYFSPTTSYGGVAVKYTD